LAARTKKGAAVAAKLSGGVHGARALLESEEEAERVRVREGTGLELGY